MIAIISRLNRTGVESRLRGAIRFPGRRTLVGRNVEFVGSRRNLRVGAGTAFYGNAYLNYTRGHLHIGANSHFDQFVVLQAQGGITIGTACAVASGVIIYSQTNVIPASINVRVVDASIEYAPVVIGDDVWLGAGAIVLPGVRVGNHAVVGAGSVVRHSVEVGEIVAGVPARRIGTREVSE